MLELEGRLKGFLRGKKAAILSGWSDLIFKGYPPDTATFLQRQKDQFANPVGHAVLEATETLYEELLAGMDSADLKLEKSRAFLDNLIRIRAVQDFTPSGAISFVFALKQTLRRQIEEAGDEKESLLAELPGFESLIDNLALFSFDIYMHCREKLYQISADEVKRSTFRLLEMANLICGAREGESEQQGPDDGNNNKEER